MMVRKSSGKVSEIFDRLILDSSQRIFRVNIARTRKRRSIVLAAFVLAVLSFSFYSFFVAADIFNFYPTSCLGTWEKPENAQGRPELDTKAVPQDFNETNSAVFRGDVKQIFCGGFKTDQENANKIFKIAVLKFSWTMIDMPAVTPVLEQSEFEKRILELNPTEEIIVVPDATSSPSQIFEENLGGQATSTPLPTDRVQTTAVPATPPPISLPTDEPELEATPQASPPVLTSTPMPEETSSPLPAPEPGSETSGTSGAVETATGSSTTGESPPATSSFHFSNRVFAVADEASSTSGSPSFLEALFERVIEIKNSPSVPQETAPQEPESVSQNFAGQGPASPSLDTEPDAEMSASPVPLVTTASTSFLDVVSASQETNTASESSGLLSTDEENLTTGSPENFFEILYSTDGQSWNLIANVNRKNFHDLEIPLPVDSWDELGTLQIMINVLPSDHDLPQVFLDSVWIEAEYEDLAILNPTQIINAVPDVAKIVPQRLANIDERARQEIESVYLAQEEFVYRLADINKDGFNDFGVMESADENNFAIILSGNDGTMLGRFPLAGQYPGVMVSIGDSDTDGFEDVAVLDPGYSSNEGGTIKNERGRINAYSGRNSGILWTYVGDEDYQFQNGNTAMALMKSKSGDTRLLVGAPGKSAKAVRAGAILVVDPASGKVIKEYHGETADKYLGMNFAVGPDLNGDGWPEVSLGERYQEISGHESAGQARVISGNDFSTISIFQGDPQNNGFVGIGVVFVDDLNGDGIADLMIESREDNNSSDKGVIYTVSPTDGSLIKKIDDPALYKGLRSIFLIH